MHARHDFVTSVSPGHGAWATDSRHGASVSAVRRPSQIIAHRGASRAAPENTVAAFHRARQLGADAVELDVRTTADGRLAVHHDAELPDGRFVADVDAADLPAHVPDLMRALDACAGMWVNIEIKYDDPVRDPDRAISALVLDLLRARAGREQVLISCFDLEVVERCRSLAPDIPTALLSIDVPDGIAASLAAQGHAAFHPWEPMVTAELIAACHTAGVAVNAWTCDDPDRMTELFAWGIDGICTNVPDIAIAARRRAVAQVTLGGDS